MKRPLFTCAILFLTVFTYAQIPIGTRLRETGGIFSHHQTQYGPGALTYTRVTLPVYQGRAVRENRIRGWYLSPVMDVSLASGTGWEPVVSAGYFNRRYLKLTEGFYLFGEGQIGLATKMLFVSGYRPAPVYSLYGLSGSLGVGATYFWKKNWGLTARCPLAELYLVHAPDILNDEQASLLFLKGHAIINAGLNASRFELSISHLIGGNDEKATLFSPKKEGIYRTGQRYIGGEIGLATLTGSPFTGLNLGFSRLRFRSPLTAEGFAISGYYSHERLSDGTSGPYRWGAGYSLVRENYLPLLPKLSLLGRTQLSVNYAGEEERTPDIRRTHTLSVSPAFSPAIQYQISDKWAVAGFVGMLTLGQAYLGPASPLAGAVSDHNTFRMGVEFSPSFRIGNSGISFRYFPGE